MKEDLNNLTERFKEITNLEDTQTKIQAIDILIEETNSSSLPPKIKERLIKTFAENQMCMVACLNFNTDDI